MTKRELAEMAASPVLWTFAALRKASVRLRPTVKPGQVRPTPSKAMAPPLALRLKAAVTVRRAALVVAPPLVKARS